MERAIIRNSSTFVDSESSEAEERTAHKPYLKRITDVNASRAAMHRNYGPHQCNMAVTTESNPYIEDEIAQIKERLFDCMREADDPFAESAAIVHQNALIHLAYVPRDVPNVEKRDLMQVYLDSTYSFAKSFILGQVSIEQAEERLDALYRDFIWINNHIDHHWSDNKMVAPIHINSESQIQIDNDRYEAPPNDYLQYIDYVARKAREAAMKKQEEAKTISVTIVKSVPNDRFRLIQLYYFYEMRCLLDFAVKLREWTITTRHCEGEGIMNNVGWVEALLRNNQCYLIVNKIKDSIYNSYILPGNIREMQIALKSPLRQLKPRDILFNIGSPIYFHDISPFFQYNIGILWDDIQHRIPDEIAAKSDMAWDVRQNVILYFFYFLFLLQKGTEFTFNKKKLTAEKCVYLVSIYTLRFDAFVFEEKDGHLIGFQRRWYLFKRSCVDCFEGFHALENGLYAWSSYVFGENNAFTRLLTMRENGALPDSYSTRNNINTTGTYASTQMEGSVFNKS